MTTTPEGTQGRRSSRSPRRAASGKAKPSSTGRRRRPALIGLAILLVVGGAAVAGLLAVRMDTRVEVIVAARPIAVGATITQDDLAVARVASEGLDLISANQASQVVGRFASSSIPAGRLLDRNMLSSEGFLSPGEAAVGVTLGNSVAPSGGLLPGDVVQVIQLGAAPDAAVLVERAVVAASGGGAATSSNGGNIVGGSSGAAGGASGAITLIVDQDIAPQVALAAADGGVALVLVEAAGSVDGTN